MEISFFNNDARTIPYVKQKQAQRKKHLSLHLTHLSKNSLRIFVTTDFPNTTLKAQVKKAKADKWHFIEIENSCSDKDTITLIKRKYGLGKSTCKSHIHLIKNLYSEY